MSMNFKIDGNKGKEIVTEELDEKIEDEYEEVEEVEEPTENVAEETVEEEAAEEEPAAIAEETVEEKAPEFKFKTDLSSIKGPAPKEINDPTANFAKRGGLFSKIFGKK